MLLGQAQWTQLLRGCHVIVFCDNGGSLYTLASGTSEKPQWGGSARDGDVQVMRPLIDPALDRTGERGKQPRRCTIPWGSGSSLGSPCKTQPL